MMIANLIRESETIDDVLGTMRRIEGAFSSKEGPRYRDFVRVNDILERTESSLRPVLANGLVRGLDAKLGDLDSVLVM
jgi:hypothetical protein